MANTAKPAEQAPALLLIDVQQGFLQSSWGERNNPNAEVRMQELLTAWRQRGWPVVHIRHDSTWPESPLRPGQPGNDFQPAVAPIPGEPVFPKSVNSGFIGTQLEPWLRAQDIERLVIVGLTTDHCVSTTTRMAGNLGFETYLVGDATATFAKTASDGTVLSAEALHQAHLASLDGEFCQVVPASVPLSW